MDPLLFILFLFPGRPRYEEPTPPKIEDPADSLVGKWCCSGAGREYVFEKTGPRCLRIKNPEWPAWGYFDSGVIYIRWDDGDYVGRFRLTADGALDGGYLHNNKTYWPRRFERKK